MTSSDAALASSSPTTQQTNQRRKSGRAVRKPDVFAGEQHGGSLLSNGSIKRKRQVNGDSFVGEDDDEMEGEDSDVESEGFADEEELRERRRQLVKNKAAAKPTKKRPKTSNDTATTLAIRPANVPSKIGSQKAKIQKARSRQSQVNQEGLYGTYCFRSICRLGLIWTHSRSLWAWPLWRRRRRQVVSTVRTK